MKFIISHIFFCSYFGKNKTYEGLKLCMCEALEFPVKARNNKTYEGLKFLRSFLLTLPLMRNNKTYEGLKWYHHITGVGLIWLETIRPMRDWNPSHHHHQVAHSSETIRPMRDWNHHLLSWWGRVLRETIRPMRDWNRYIGTSIISISVNETIRPMRDWNTKLEHHRKKTVEGNNKTYEGLKLLSVPPSFDSRSRNNKTYEGLKCLRGTVCVVAICRKQ